MSETLVNNSKLDNTAHHIPESPLGVYDQDMEDLGFQLTPADQALLGYEPEWGTELDNPEPDNTGLIALRALHFDKRFEAAERIAEVKDGISKWDTSDVDNNPYLENPADFVGKLSPVEKEQWAQNFFMKFNLSKSDVNEIQSMRRADKQSRLEIDTDTTSKFVDLALYSAAYFAKAMIYAKDHAEELAAAGIQPSLLFSAYRINKQVADKQIKPYAADFAFQSKIVPEIRAEKFSNKSDKKFNNEKRNILALAVTGLIPNLDPKEARL